MSTNATALALMLDPLIDTSWVAAGHRPRSGLTQKDVVACMRTSQSAIGRIERGEIYAKLSTVERYASAIGHRPEWRVSKA